MPLICYVHVPGVLTPHIRFLGDVAPDEMAVGIAEVMHEWPNCARVELYDERDIAIAKYDCLLRKPGGHA